MIQLSDLSRQFGARLAVDHVSFAIPAGQLCVLLGPNGAGKTTTVRMLMGLIPPTSGSALVAGVTLPGDPRTLPQLRARVGLLTEAPGFYERLTASENLRLFGRLYGLSAELVETRTRPLLDRLGLLGRRDELVGTFSKGMKQKLAVVRAIFHDPDVVFFDEPTAGLDPESARVVREMIRDLKRAGRTMIVCTHNLTEGNALADVVAILRSKLLAFGPVAGIADASVTKRCKIVVGGEAGAARDVVMRQPGVTSIEIDGSTLDVRVDDVRRQTPALVSALVSAGYDILEVRPQRRTLEEFYLEAIGTAS